MIGPKGHSGQTELMKQFKVAPDDPLAPSLLLIDRATNALENAAKRALVAARAAADATYQRLVSEILDRISNSLIQRATTRGILIGVLIITVPLTIDHAWLKFDFDREVDAEVAAQLSSTPEDLKFVLAALQSQPKIKRNLVILESLENSRQGFTEWANHYGVEAFDLFSYNDNNNCPILFQFRSGTPGCAFKDPFGKVLTP